MRRAQNSLEENRECQRQCSKKRTCKTTIAQEKDLNRHLSKEDIRTTNR